MYDLYAWQYRAILLFCVLVGLWPALTYAGAGHDHGHDHEQDAYNEPTRAVTPRLLMASKHFELVIVQEPHGLQLYLDDYASNAPITTATIELEIDGESLAVESADQGTYHAHLEESLSDGTHTVMATLVTDTASDLLVDEWDIHLEHKDEEASDTATKISALHKLLPVWLGIGSGMGIVLLSTFWRDWQNRGANCVEK